MVVYCGMHGMIPVLSTSAYLQNTMAAMRRRRTNTAVGTDATTAVKLPGMNANMWHNAP